MQVRVYVQCLWLPYIVARIDLKAKTTNLATPDLEKL